ncbi:TetR/AcrR family transcriptional regulator [Nocardia wallacei]|uniref:TetR/AcrR family transcriptional regulator n=1 Tax=Nocardia wallacei TaxID=480035 RepID=UPI0024546DCD|nr:helix-turn-helix domain-containing protein [Nocardia wallacei]
MILTRHQRQALTRERLLAAARELFAEHGYDGASVDAIAAEAGLTRGAVYSGFPSKRALFAEVLASAAEADRDRARGRRGPVTPVVVLERFAAAVLESAARWCALQDLLMIEPVLRPAYAGASAVGTAALAATVQAAAGDTGALAAQRWAGVADAAVSVLYGGVRGWWGAAAVVAPCAAMADLHAPAAAVARNGRVSVGQGPAEGDDVLSGRPARPVGGGLVVSAGLADGSAVAAAIRDHPDRPVTVRLSATVTEHAAIARCALAEMGRGLYRAAPPALVPIQSVLDTG